MHRTGDAGVYSIRQTESGHTYIGKSRNVVDRMHEHRLKLRRGHHSNVALQTDWDASGEKSFAFELVEQIDGDAAALAAAEMRHWRAQQDPYNAMPPGLGNRERPSSLQLVCALYGDVNEAAPFIAKLISLSQRAAARERRALLAKEAQ